MTSPQGRKGAKAEREAAELITELTGFPCRRQLGAGRQDDVGDIDIKGANIAIQVANWSDVSRAAIKKPPEAQRQAENAGADYAATFVRFRGGKWRVVLTPRQWAQYVEAIYGENRHSSRGDEIGSSADAVAERAVREQSSRTSHSSRGQELKPFTPFTDD